jgi:dipeptidyl aminopeptidase/acylaminoacyl peptidase
MAQPLTPEAFVYGIRRVSDPQVSPDGSRVVYVLSAADPADRRERSQLWLRDIDGGNPVQLTYHGESHGEPRWSPDGAFVAFTSDRGEGTGLFLTPMTRPGEPREVVRHRSGIEGIAWSPDGSRIAYIAPYDPANPDDREPDPNAAPKIRVIRRADYKLDGPGFLNDARGHVWVVDLASGERRRLTTAYHEHFSPAWSPDGRSLAVGQANWAESRSQLLLIDAESGEQTIAWPDVSEVEGWAWSPSGDRLAFFSEERITRQPNLFLYELDSGATRRLTKDLAILPLAAPAWLDDETLLVSGAREAKTGLYWVDVHSGTVEPAIERAGSLGGWGGLSIDRRSDVVVQEYGDLETIDELAVFDLQRDDLVIITEYNREFLGDYPPAGWEHLTIHRDGFDIAGWLFTPFDFDPAKRYPLVVSVHGGPESFYGYRYDQHLQILANNGFLVLATNPRGSVSYGREFAEVVWGDWGIGPLADVIALLDHVLERPYIDPDRLGICGGSYGSYLTNFAIGRTDRFKAAISDAVTFDLESQYLTGDVDFAYGDYGWAGLPSKNPDWYREQSPSTYAHQVTAATLIMNGEDDERTPIGQSEAMFTALMKSGCEVEYVRYPGGSHDITRVGPEHKVDYLQRHIDWFKRYLGEPE